MKKVFLILFLLLFNVTFSQTKAVQKKTVYNLSTAENSFKTLAELLLKNDTVSIKTIVLPNGYFDLKRFGILKNARSNGKQLLAQIKNKKVSLVTNWSRDNGPERIRMIELENSFWPTRLIFIKTADSADYKFSGFYSEE